jgi:UTP--glucose-1-phosphate uridylyltransferase
MLPTRAEQERIVPGLRAGHYLCFFGMHAFTPAVFGVPEELGPQGLRGFAPEP